MKKQFPSAMLLILVSLIYETPLFAKSENKQRIRFDREGVEIYIPFQEWLPEPFFYESSKVDSSRLIRLPHGLATHDLSYGKRITVFGVGSIFSEKKKQSRGTAVRDRPLQPKSGCSDLNATVGASTASDQEISSFADHFLNIPFVSSGQVFEIVGSFNALGQKPFVRGNVKFSIHLPEWETSEKEIYLSLSSQDLDGKWVEVKRTYSTIENNDGGLEVLEIHSNDVPSYSRIKLEFSVPQGASIQLYDARLFGVSHSLPKKRTRSHS